MIHWIYPNQLDGILNKQLQSIYILFGNNLYLLKDTQLNILNVLKLQQNTEILKVELNIHYTWIKIINFCSTINLFTKKKILILNFPKNYPINYFNKNCILLSSCIHSNLILILTIYTMHQITRYITCINHLNKTALFINCITLENNQLGIWLKNQSKYMQLTIEDSAFQVLCYSYEGNQKLLQQMLLYLTLIYPDRYLNCLRLQNIINDSAFFNENHWIEAFLVGNKQRANRVLKKLEYRNFNWNILLYKIQNEILIVTNIKYNLTQRQSLSLLLTRFQVYTQYRRLILSKAIKRLSFNQLRAIISLLVQMELKHRKYFIYLNKSYFEILMEISYNTNPNFLFQIISDKNIS